MMKKLISFFKQSFTSGIKDSKLIRTNWVEIADTDAIEKMVYRSNRKPQIIFKHSTRCPVSSQAYSEVSSITDDIAAEADINYVDVISQREISQEIARRFRVIENS